MYYKFHGFRYLPVQDLTTVCLAKEVKWCPGLANSSLAYHGQKTYSSHCEGQWDSLKSGVQHIKMKLVC